MLTRLGVKFRIKLLHWGQHMNMFRNCCISKPSVALDTLSSAACDAACATTTSNSACCFLESRSRTLWSNLNRPIGKLYSVPLTAAPGSPREPSLGILHRSWSLENVNEKCSQPAVPRHLALHSSMLQSTLSKSNLRSEPCCCKQRQQSGTLIKHSNASHLVPTQMTCFLCHIVLLCQQLPIVVRSSFLALFCKF